MPIVHIDSSQWSLVVFSVIVANAIVIRSSIIIVITAHIILRLDIYNFNNIYIILYNYKIMITRIF